MNRLPLLFLALAATTASAAALAQMQPRDHGANRGQAHGQHGEISRLDANADGRISRAELAGDGKLASRLDKDFAAIDTNRDGYIVRTELRAWQATQQAQRKAKMQERAAQHFADADLDHDGKLSKSEVAAKLPQLQKSFAWMDDNRDGFLSPAEWHPARR